MVEDGIKKLHKILGYGRLAKVKKEIGFIEPDLSVNYGNGKGMPYVSFGKMQSIIGPLLEKYNLDVVFGGVELIESSSSPSISMAIFKVELIDTEAMCVISKFKYVFTVDNSKNRSSIQNIGSTITYAMRYIYKMLFSLSTVEVDSDPDLDNPHSSKKDKYEEYLRLIRKIPDEDLSIKVFSGLVQGKLDYESIKQRYTKE